MFAARGERTSAFGGPTTTVAAAVGGRRLVPPAQPPPVRSRAGRRGGALTTGANSTGSGSGSTAACGPAGATFAGPRRSPLLGRLRRWGSGWRATGPGPPARRSPLDATSGCSPASILPFASSASFLRFPSSGWRSLLRRRALGPAPSLGLAPPLLVAVKRPGGPPADPVRVASLSDMSALHGTPDTARSITSAFVIPISLASVNSHVLARRYSPFSFISPTDRRRQAAHPARTSAPNDPHARSKACGARRARRTPPAGRTTRRRAPGRCD